MLTPTHFTRWLFRQKNRDDRVGDLASDFFRSKERKPFSNYYDSTGDCTLEYLIEHDACSAAIKSFHEAHLEWMKSNNG